MDAETYRRKTADTWNTDPDVPDQKCNAALGLVGEIGEYLREPNREEMGDVLYYHATLCRLYGVEIPSISECPPAAPIGREGMRRALTLAAQIAEAVKSEVFHDNPEHWSALLAPLTRKLRTEATARQGWSIEQIRADNIAKLSARHPDGWEGAE